MASPVRIDACVLIALAVCVGCKSKKLPEPAADRSSGAIPELSVPWVEPDEIAIDGRPSEPGWSRAAHTGLFVQPGSGRTDADSRANASARVAWNDKHLYIAFVVYDPEPTTPFSRGDRDPHIWSKASGVEVMLQPGDFDDNKGYFELQVDVGGAVWDTTFDDYNHPVVQSPNGTKFGHTEWSSDLRRAAAIDRDAGRYTLELALPWKALGDTRVPAPPKPGDAWRANFYAFRDGQRDSSAWSPILGKGNFHRSSRFGRLRFTPKP